MLKHHKYVLILMPIKEKQTTEQGEVATLGRIVLNVPAASTVKDTNPAKACFSKLHSDPDLNCRQLCNVKMKQQVQQTDSTTFLEQLRMNVG